VLSPLVANIYLHELDRLRQERYRTLGALTPVRRWSRHHGAEGRPGAAGSV